MIMNNYSYNPYNMYDYIEQPPMSKTTADVICSARKHTGLYDIENLESAIKDIQLNTLYVDGNVRLQFICPTFETSISESTLRLVMSILTGMACDTNLDWKVLRMAESDEFGITLRETELFKEYFETLTSVLDPNTIYTVLEMVIIIGIILVYHSDDVKSHPIAEVSQVIGVVNLDAERIKHIAFAIRTLIIGSYRVLYSR